MDIDVNESVHWCRVVLNKSTKNIILNLNYQNFDALEISGDLWKSFPFKTYENVFYPQFDITNIPTNYKNSFDIVIAEQVFEHVRNPWIGVKNVFKILKPGGYFLITTPFLLKIHGAPEDYWRWTPTGLSILLEDSGFKIQHLDSWGNKDCVIKNLKTWATYKSGMNLENDKRIPVVVWALAQKIN